MARPIVNINGTSREELVKVHREAYEALHNALEAVRRTQPHARDYPNDHEKYLEDRSIWKMHTGTLQNIMERYLAEALVIHEQGKKKT